jgi:predicted amidophosphoribosyltransferase
VVAQLQLADPSYEDLGLAQGVRTLRGAGKVPSPAVQELIALLRDLLTLSCPGDTLEFALALDWTKLPTDGDNPYLWPRTEVYDLIHEAKYKCWQPHNAARQRLLGGALADRLSAVIAHHSVLRAFDVVAAAPDHDRLRSGFGSRLAGGVARRQQLPFVRCHGAAPFRTPVKELEHGRRAEHLHGQFRCRDDLVVGRAVLVVDDLYSTGATAAETARALQEAGAARVACLCGVKTLRSL